MSCIFAFNDIVSCAKLRKITCEYEAEANKMERERDMDGIDLKSGFVIAGMKLQTFIVVVAKTHKKLMYLDYQIVVMIFLRYSSKMKP